MPSVLVIEDNDNLADGLRLNLEVEGHAVRVARDGVSGLAMARDGGSHLIVLDLMLPGLDGYRVLEAIRDDGDDTPVLILSARGEEADKVRGFRLGADDYVAKPFGLLELMARVEALLRRDAKRRELARAPMTDVVRLGDVEIDPSRHTVTRAARNVPLRPKEFELLMALASRQGRIATRAELLDEVWGYSDEVYSRTVDTHIAELRRKLEVNPAEPRHILTVRKSGYRLAG